MNKLFYTITFAALFLAACNSASESNALDSASKNIQFGDAGTTTFQSIDSFAITADYYPNEGAKGIIILLHQAKFSRGEYKQIAKVLVDSGFACLAVDLRSGGEVNGIKNETAAKAIELGKSTEFMDARQDIVSAINFVAKNTAKEIYLWGSSYSASLALMEAVNNRNVKKVVAFSPGEYLSTQNTVKEVVSSLIKPVFITGANAEFDVIVKPIAGVIPSKNLVVYRPEGVSDHGSKTLWLNGKETDLTYEKVIAFLRK
jgi:dienelactone hydrolase